MTTTPTVPQSLADLPTSVLAQEARQNIAHYLVDRRPHDDPYAFELFRRALALGNQDAWTALYDLYGTLVKAWVAQHLPPALAEASEALVNDAFFRLFHAIDATRFGQFPSTPSLLAYLKACASSVVSDHLRSLRAHRAEEAVANLDHEIILADPGEEVLAQLFASEIWEAISAGISEEERLILQVICILGWPARKLQLLAPERFPTVKEIYRLKRNLMERLRRNRQLQTAHRTSCAGPRRHQPTIVLSPVSINKGVTK